MKRGEGEGEAGGGRVEGGPFVILRLFSGARFGFNAGWFSKSSAEKCKRKRKKKKETEENKNKEIVESVFFLKNNTGQTTVQSHKSNGQQTQSSTE